MTTREHVPLAVLAVKRAVADILQRAPAGGRCAGRPVVVVMGSYMRATTISAPLVGTYLAGSHCQPDPRSFQPQATPAPPPPRRGPGSRRR